MTLKGKRIKEQIVLLSFLTTLKDTKKYPEPKTMKACIIICNSIPLTNVYYSKHACLQQYNVQFTYLYLFGEIIGKIYQRM